MYSNPLHPHPLFTLLSDRFFIIPPIRLPFHVIKLQRSNKATGERVETVLVWERNTAAFPPAATAPHTFAKAHFFSLPYLSFPFRPVPPLPSPPLSLPFPSLFFPLRLNAPPPLPFALHRWESSERLLSTSHPRIKPLRFPVDPLPAPLLSTPMSIHRSQWHCTRPPAESPTAAPAPLWLSTQLGRWEIFIWLLDEGLIDLAEPMVLQKSCKAPEAPEAQAAAQPSVVDAAAAATKHHQNRRCDGCRKNPSSGGRLVCGHELCCLCMKKLLDHSHAATSSGKPMPRITCPSCRKKVRSEGTPIKAHQQTRGRAEWRRRRKRRSTRRKGEGEGGTGGGSEGGEEEEEEDAEKEEQDEEGRGGE